MSRIEDVGAKIGGARKDLFKLGFAVTDYESLNAIERERELVKAKLWPTPDYAKMVESGTPVEVAIRLKSIRDRIPTDIPSGGAGWTWRVPFDVESRRRAYVEAVLLFRDAAKGVQKMEDIEKLKSVFDGLPAEGRLSMDTLRRRDYPMSEYLKPRTLLGVMRKEAKAIRNGWPLEKHRTAKPRRQYPQRITAENPERKGPESSRRGISVSETRLMETFGLRAVEFGEWVDQKERQATVNTAYDAFEDLAYVMGIPKKAIGMNGWLAVAFGSRGKGGQDTASAHYEPARRVINLTKPRGAGALSHEWFHALDHHIGCENKELLVFATEVAASVDGKVFRETLDAALYRPKTSAEVAAENSAQAARRERNITGWSKHAFPNEMERVFADGSEFYEKWLSAKAKMLAGDAKGIDELLAIAQSINPRKKKFSDDVEAGLVGNMVGPTPSSKPADTEFLKNAKKWDSYRSGDPYYTQPKELAARVFEAYVSDRLAEDGRRNDYLVHGTGDQEIYPSGDERQTVQPLGLAASRLAQERFGRRPADEDAPPISLAGTSHQNVVPEPRGLTQGSLL